jgi:hypothetical protein
MIILMELRRIPELDVVQKPATRAADLQPTVNAMRVVSIE